SIENQTLAHFRHFSSLFTNFPSTTVVSALQIAHFMQNKPNFQKDQMNVNMVLTVDYEKKTLGERGKNKPNSNPIQTQSNPIKANKMPKQTQYKPKQTQSVVSLSNLFHLRSKAVSRSINRLSPGIRLATLLKKYCTFSLKFRLQCYIKSGKFVIVIGRLLRLVPIKQLADCYFCKIKLA
ncbi:MAG TPA: hypothetical protein HPP66_14320, partial [Planctomycetes bacterium]|nr:hypothetical protein [Planctomycetota bacterium]